MSYKNVLCAYDCEEDNVQSVLIEECVLQPDPEKVLRNQYVEDNATSLHETVDRLKERYEDRGFLDTLKVEKILRAISQNIVLKKTEEESVEEKDLYADDFEFYDLELSK